MNLFSSKKQNKIDELICAFGIISAILITVIEIAKYLGAFNE